MYTIHVIYGTHTKSHMNEHAHISWSGYKNNDTPKIKVRIINQRVQLLLGIHVVSNVTLKSGVLLKKTFLKIYPA